MTLSCKTASLPSGVPNGCEVGQPNHSAQDRPMDTSNSNRMRTIHDTPSRDQGLPLQGQADHEVETIGISNSFSDDKEDAKEQPNLAILKTAPKPGRSTLLDGALSNQGMLTAPNVSHIANDFVRQTVPAAMGNSSSLDKDYLLSGRCTGSLKTAAQEPIAIKDADRLQFSSAMPHEATWTEMQPASHPSQGSTVILQRTDTAYQPSAKLLQGNKSTKEASSGHWQLAKKQYPRSSLPGSPVGTIGVYKPAESLLGMLPAPGIAAVEFDSTLYMYEKPTKQLIRCRSAASNTSTAQAMSSGHLLDAFEVMPTPTRPVKRMRFQQFGASTRSLQHFPDTSWPMSGERHENKIMVGPQFQCSVGPYCTASNDWSVPVDNICIWDPVKAEHAACKGEPIAEFIGARGTLQLQALKLQALHSSGYNVKDAKEQLQALVDAADEIDSVLVGKDETMFRQLLSEGEGTEHTKNFHKIAKTMGRTLQTILINYYIWKGSNKESYHGLKAKRHEEPDACEVCQDGGDLVLCDNCNKAYHWKTCLPCPLDKLPAKDANWYCEQCVQGTPAKLRHLCKGGGHRLDTGPVLPAQVALAIPDRLQLHLLECHLELDTPMPATIAYNQQEQCNAVLDNAMVWDARLQVYRHIEATSSDQSQECQQQRSDSQNTGEAIVAFSTHNDSGKGMDGSASSMESLASIASSVSSGISLDGEAGFMWQQDILCSSDSSFHESDVSIESESLGSDKVCHGIQGRNGISGSSQQHHQTTRPKFLPNASLDIYHTLVPVGPDGLGILLGRTSSNRVTFQKYRRVDGRMSLAEVQGVFKNPGDEILEIEGMSCMDKSFMEVINLIKLLVMKSQGQPNPALQFRVRNAAPWSHGNTTEQVNLQNKHSQAFPLTVCGENAAATMNEGQPCMESSAESGDMGQTAGARQGDSIQNIHACINISQVLQWPGPSMSALPNSGENADFKHQATFQAHAGGDRPTDSSVPWQGRAHISGHAAYSQMADAYDTVHRPHSNMVIPGGNFGEHVKVARTGQLAIDRTAAIPCRPAATSNSKTVPQDVNLAQQAHQSQATASNTTFAAMNTAGQQWPQWAQQANDHTATDRTQVARNMNYTAQFVPQSLSALPSQNVQAYPVQRAGIVEALSGTMRLSKRTHSQHVAMEQSLSKAFSNHPKFLQFLQYNGIRTAERFYSTKSDTLAHAWAMHLGLHSADNATRDYIGAMKYRLRDHLQSKP